MRGFVSIFSCKSSKWGNPPSWGEIAEFPAASTAVIPNKMVSRCYQPGRCFCKYYLTNFKTSNSENCHAIASKTLTRAYQRVIACNDRVVTAWQVTSSPPRGPLPLYSHLIQQHNIATTTVKGSTYGYKRKLMVNWIHLAKADRGSISVTDRMS